MSLTVSIHLGKFSRWLKRSSGSSWPWNFNNTVKVKYHKLTGSLTLLKFLYDVYFDSLFTIINLLFFNLSLILLSEPFLDTQVSPEPTPVSWSVSWSVTLSDFQSLVSNGRSNKKSSKNKVHLFSNFASGRTLPTHKNVYEGFNAQKCIWRLKCSKM